MNSSMCSNKLTVQLKFYVQYVAYLNTNNEVTTGLCLDQRLFEKKKYTP